MMEYSLVECVTELVKIFAVVTWIQSSWTRPRDRKLTDIVGCKDTWQQVVSQRLQ